MLRLSDGVKKTLNGQTEDNTAYENEGDIYYTRTEMPFNSLMTEFFEGSDVNDLINVRLHTSRHRLKTLNFLRLVLHLIK